jgi:hypothetical protein
MNANEVVWPTGMSDQDPAARERPLFFNPQGFLVAILQDTDQADQAKAALVDTGFAETDLRVYTSSQILDSWERFQAQRSLPNASPAPSPTTPTPSSSTSATPARAARRSGSMSPTRLTPSGSCAP